MNDSSRRPTSPLRIIARLVLAGAFLGIAGGGLYAVHFINKKFRDAPVQVYVPVGKNTRASAAAADAMRSRTLKWNLYRADAGFSIAAPASFTITFPRPSADLFLSDIRTDGRAVIRASVLGAHLGAQPFSAWKRGATSVDMGPLEAAHFGRIDNVRADAFVAGWFNHEREDEGGRLQCISTLELLSNTPVGIEVCSSYGLEYDTALLNTALPTTEANQKSTDFMDAAIEQAADDAFSQLKEAPPPAASTSRGKLKKGPREKAASAADPASDVAIVPAPKLSPREIWQQSRQVACFGKPLAEIEACYAQAAKDETQNIQDGNPSGYAHPASETSDDDQPGVDVVAPGKDGDTSGDSDKDDKDDKDDNDNAADSDK
jgi:hypothetical protein